MTLPKTYSFSFFATLFFAMVTMLTACGQATSGATATLPQATPTNSPVRATLPPTWTPTTTFTPEPPTELPAPPTATPTETATPMMSANDICQNYFLVTNLQGLRGASPILFFTQNSDINLIVSTNTTDVKVHFVAVNRVSGKENGTDIPGGTMLGVNFPVKYLPGFGQFDWTLTVQSPIYGDLCKKSGTFYVVGRDSTREEENTIR